MDKKEVRIFTKHHCHFDSEGKRCGWLSARSGDAVIAENPRVCLGCYFGGDAVRNNLILSVAWHCFSAVSVGFCCS